MKARLGAIAAAVLVASACSPTRLDPPGANSPGLPAPTNTSAARSPTGQPTPLTPTPRPTSNAELIALMRRVGGEEANPQGELNVVWQSIIEDIPSDLRPEYGPPSRLVGYMTGEVPDVACGEGTTWVLWAYNARYCPTDRSIAFDELLFLDLSTRLGKYAPVAILTHEWGHYIQDLLGFPPHSIQTELQADCMAGLFLANTNEVLPGVTDPDDDVVTALKAFFEAGDDLYLASDWFLRDVHGSDQQRIRAFSTGFLASYRTPDYPPPVGRGLAVCEGYRDFKPNDRTEIGPYRLLNLPGRTESAVEDGYDIQPDARLGLPSSSVVLAWIEGQTSDEIVSRLGVRFPGFSVLPGTTIDLAGNLASGSGFANYVEQRDDSLVGGVRSGLLGLVEPTSSGGALAILVYRPLPPPAEPPTDSDNQTLMEQTALLYETLARLCHRDESLDVLSPNLNLACLETQ